MPGCSSLYAQYDESCRDMYRRLGIRTVGDLRAEREMTRAPSAWADVCGARLVCLPVAEGGEGADTNYIRMLLDGELDRFDADDMAAFYIQLLERRADRLGDAYRILAVDSNLPVLVHCAAGKDRTGVFIALVLSSLGVPDELVVQDYALTEVLRPNRIDAYAERFVAAGRDPEIARVLFESPAIAMASMLRYLREEFGGVRGYLVQHAQVTAEAIGAVGANLLSQ